MQNEITPVARSATRRKNLVLTCCRRQFLFKGSLLAAVAAALPVAGWSNRVQPGLVPLSALSLAAFAGLLQTSFKVRPTPGSIVELTLQKAQDLSSSKQFPSRARAARCEGFSLIFSGPPGQALPQDTYCFEHTQVGRFNMFIVPVGQPRDGVTRYEAIFSRPCQEGKSRREA